MEIDSNSQLQSYDVLRNWQLARLRDLARQEETKTLATPATFIEFDKAAIREFVAGSSASIPAEQERRSGVLLTMVLSWLAVQVLSIVSLMFTKADLIEGLKWWTDVTLMSLWHVPSHSLSGWPEKCSYCAFFVLPMAMAGTLPTGLVQDCARRVRLSTVDLSLSVTTLVIVCIAGWLILFSFDAPNPSEGLTLFPQNETALAQTLLAWSTIIFTLLFCVIKMLLASIQRAVELIYSLRRTSFADAGIGERSADLDAAMDQLRTFVLETIQRENAIADFSRTVILSFDKRFLVSALSPNVLMHWGYFQHDLLGRDLRKVIFADDLETFERTVNLTDKSHPLELVTRIRRSDNTIVDVQWFMEWSSKYNGFFAAGIDVTDRMNLERGRRSFLAQLTHDMRSPLSAINVSLSAIKSQNFGQLTAPGLLMVDRSQSGLMRILDLINEMLEAETLRSGRANLSKSNFDIGEVCQCVVNELLPLSAERQVTVKVACIDVTTNADKKLITRVFANIISNAIGFSPKQGTVEINIQVAAEMALVKICDQGPGIPLDYQQLIFERFGIAKRRDTSQRTSTGLGLSICRDIIVAHGGLIGVESKIGSGSTFWFTVPLAVATTASE